MHDDALARLAARRSIGRGLAGPVGAGALGTGGCRAVWVDDKGMLVQGCVVDVFVVVLIRERRCSAAQSSLACSARVNQLVQ